jgi:DNA-binding FrmR family transcriptional regulator
MTHDGSTRSSVSPRHCQTPQTRGVAHAPSHRDFDEGRSCLQLAQQLQAVEKAISEAKRRLIHDHVDHCLDVAANGAGAAPPQIVSEFKAISRYL